MSGRIEVTLAERAEAQVLGNLLQFYVHDFSEFWAGSARGELENSGRFWDWPLEDYWRDEERVPLLIRAGGSLAGFALLDRTSHTGKRVDRNMAEFFIVRKHRRCGAGTVAARTIFSRYPGVWEAAVARPNLAALAFWRRAAGRHPAVTEIEETDFRTQAWDGPILRFRVG